MDWPTDTLAGVYLFLFAFGLLFSVASLLLGAAHGHAHLPGGHGHLGHTGQAAPGAHGHGAHAPAYGHAAGHGHDTHAAAPAPVNISTAMVFLTWFGAAGYILRVYADAVVGASLLAAVLAGLAGAALVYLFLSRVLWRGQTELDPANYVIDGTLARVSAPIHPGGTGEVVYALDRKQQVAGARGLAGETIPVGAEVEIVRYEGGLAYVRPWTGALSDGPFSGLPIEPLSLPPPERGRARKVEAE